jgi:hypothetical protein
MKITEKHIKFEGDDKFFTDTLVGWVGIEKFQEICADSIELKRIIQEMANANIVVPS